MYTKKIAFILSLFIVLNTPIYAISLDKYIANMQKASPQKRVKMMNNLKRSLAKMNSADRQKTIAKLRNKNQSRTTSISSLSKRMVNIAKIDQMNQAINSQRTNITNNAQVIKDRYISQINSISDNAKNIINDNKIELSQ